MVVVGSLVESFYGLTSDAKKWSPQGIEVGWKAGLLQAGRRRTKSKSRESSLEDRKGSANRLPQTNVVAVGSW